RLRPRERMCAPERRIAAFSSNLLSGLRQGRRVRRVLAHLSYTARKKKTKCEQMTHIHVRQAGSWAEQFALLLPSTQETQGCVMPKSSMGLGSLASRSLFPIHGRLVPLSRLPPT